MRKLCFIALAAGVSIFSIPALAYDGNGDDAAQISNLLRTYSYALDHHDGAGWASVFTPDGIFQDDMRCLTGSAQIFNVAEHFGDGSHGTEPKSHHFVQPGPIVYQDKDHATMQNFVMVVGDVARGQKEGGGLRVTGLYHDKLVRLNGKWLIASRIEDIYGMKPQPPCVVPATLAAYTPPPARTGYQGTGDDYAQIEDALRRYSWGFDHHDGVAWAAAFTPNGEFHDQSFCLIGRQAFIDLENKPRAPRDPNAPPPPPRAPSSGHLVQMGPVTYQDKDHATMHNYVIIVSGGTRGGNDARISVTGTYEDMLERVDGHWLIAHRMEYSPGDKPPLPCPGK